jgi:hypothetical protein
MARHAKQSTKDLKRKLERAEGGDVKAADELKQADNQSRKSRKRLTKWRQTGPSGRDRFNPAVSAEARR